MVCLDFLKIPFKYILILSINQLIFFYFRTGRQGRLIIDGQHFRGRSQGVLQMLNVKGNIFVGK